MNVTRRELPDHETMVSRIMAVYGEVTPEDVTAGKLWYPRALETAVTLGRPYGIHPDIVAAVISATSPRMPWGRNLSVSAEILRRFSVHGSRYDAFTGLGLSKCVNLAVDILHGLDPWDALKLKRLAFWRNIVGDTAYVTVDTWAVKIACGREYTSPGSCYADIADAYSDAAELAGMSPRDLQAVTWRAYRRDAVTEQTLAWLDGRVDRD